MFNETYLLDDDKDDREIGYEKPYWSDIKSRMTSIVDRQLPHLTKERERKESFGREHYGKDQKFVQVASDAEVEIDDRIMCNQF